MNELDILAALLADPKKTQARLDELKAAEAEATVAERKMREFAEYKAEVEAAVAELRKRHDDATAQADKRAAAREVEIAAREKRAVAAEQRALEHEAKASAIRRDVEDRYRKFAG
jgi:hypothetical protein